MLNYTPKVGEILQCNFGSPYSRGVDGSLDYSKLSVETRLPPEMVKNRLVVVLNARLSNGCMVVPLSKTLDQDRFTRKWHVGIPAQLISEMPHFSSAVRYATAEHLQLASRDRLNRLQGGTKQFLPREVVAEIQRAVVRAIGGMSLLAVVPVAVPPSHVEMHTHFGAVNDPSLGAPKVERNQE